MEIRNKKHAISLGVRIGLVFLMAVIAVIMVAYFVLSQNFQGMMTDYTIRLIETMTSQGVKMVETELETRQEEISLLAESFKVPDAGDNIQEFPQPYAEGEYLRMLYITYSGTMASDGRQRDVRGRQDVREAFEGETAVYGPYFNEENEYVVCYSAPVMQDGEIVGVLSVEKDGYRFCKLIENIRFVNSGESYIINAEGTDIAVSDQSHIEWVDTQYNARELLEEQRDEETKSILELEQNGLDGKSGIGTYYWHDGLCYLAYEPIQSVGWVLLVGIREEEIASLTQSVFFASISEGPVLGICLFLVIVLTALIIYWIISSMKKNDEINEKLRVIANYDALTGLMNRNSYHTALDRLSEGKKCSFACIYIDVNGLHELNNHLGHQAGDQMLKAVADALRHMFPKEEIYRIGGDEFVVLCRGQSGKEIYHIIEQVRKSLRDQNYEISVGISWQEDNENAIIAVNEAETLMQKDKKRYYQENGNERRMRTLDNQLEQMIKEKQDAESFLEVLAPEFKGVYFVNLSNDRVRHLYIPSYFEECLLEADDHFSKAFLLYAQRNVKPEYYHYFEKLCNYADLQNRLEIDHVVELTYQKLNDEWLRLKILKFKEQKDETQETLWIFETAD